MLRFQCPIDNGTLKALSDQYELDVKVDNFENC